MEQFLGMLLKLSLLGSLLALALTALRPLLRGRVSRAAAYYLWLLVLLRLCVPAGFDLPVPAAAEASVPDPAQAVQPAPVSPPDIPGIAPDADPSETLPETEPPRETEEIAPAQPEVSSAQGQQPLVSSRVNAALHWLRDPALWALLWWFGTLTSVGWFALGYLRMYERVRRTAVSASPEAYALLRELSRGSRVELVESPAVTTPLLLGVVHPTIVLPAGVTDPDRLRDILAHELTHVRRKDLLVKWFAAIVTSFHWFNPVMLLVRRETGRNCELACDEAVMKSLTAPERRHYGETLLALAAHAPKGLGPLAVTLCEEKKQLKERLYCIVKYKRSGPMVIFLSLLLAAVVGACSLVTGVKPAEPDAPAPLLRDEQQTPPAEPEDAAVYDLDGGLTIAVPKDIADQVQVVTGGIEDSPFWGELAAFFEKQSYDEMLEKWNFEGGGFLFGIDRYTQAEYEDFLAHGSVGGQPFAIDSAGNYYMYISAEVLDHNYGFREDQSEERLAAQERLKARREGILADFISRNGLEPYSSLHAHAQALYQSITKETSPDSGEYDFTVRVEQGGKTDEFHITRENGYNVAFVGNYLSMSYTWEEADAADWLARDHMGTVLTLASADGKSSIRCRSADDVVELVQDGGTRYARVRDPETPEDPDPHLRYSLLSFLMIIPDDAFNSSAWDGTADGSLSPAEAAAVLAESVAERYRNTPDWLDWKPLDFQVESAEVFDVYNGEDLPNFCFNGGFCVQLDDPNYMHWQAGSGLDAPITEGPFAGYYRWGREIFVMKNANGDWYIADMGTGGGIVEFPGWSWSSGTDNSLEKAPLEELADLFFLTEGDTHAYRLPSYICRRPAEELAGLNGLLDRRTGPEAQELCRALAAYLNAGFGESYSDTLRSLEDLNALLSPAYQAYTADVPALGE